MSSYQLSHDEYTALSFGLDHNILSKTDPNLIYTEFGCSNVTIKIFHIKLKLTVCFYHVTYAFQSESTLYSCLNVKELLARNRREI